MARPASFRAGCVVVGIRRNDSMHSVAFILFLALSRTDADPIVRSWALLHSTADRGGGGAGGEDFRRRGRIQLAVDESRNEVKLELENDPDAMKGFNDQGWYRLKLVPEQSGSSTSLFQDGVETTVPACQLRRSNFRDEVILMFGEAGQVLSMSYMPLVSPLAPKSCDELDAATEHPELSSKISYETPTPGMSLRTVLAGEKPPPGLKALPHKRNHNPANANTNGANPLLNDGSNNGQPPPPPAGPFGFLSRYWYILLPLMLLNIFLAPADQQQQPASPDEAERGRPGGAIAQQGSAASSPRAVEGASNPTRSPSAPSSAAGTAAAPGGSARQRRGKRG